MRRANHGCDFTHYTKMILLAMKLIVHHDWPTVGNGTGKPEKASQRDPIFSCDELQDMTYSYIEMRLRNTMKYYRLAVTSWTVHLNNYVMPGWLPPALLHTKPSNSPGLASEISYEQ